MRERLLQLRRPLRLSSGVRAAVIHRCRPREPSCVRPLPTHLFYLLSTWFVLSLTHTTTFASFQSSGHAHGFVAFLGERPAGILDNRRCVQFLVAQTQLARCEVMTIPLHAYEREMR